MQSKELVWKWLLILAVVGMSLLWTQMYELALGPDLKGGTTLLYKINVPDGADAGNTLNEVVDFVQRRLDPAGVRNIRVTIESGNRLQILMPPPTEAVQEKQRAYQAALDALRSANVSRGKILAALQAEGEAKRANLAALVQGVEARQALFDRLVELDDQRKAARAKLKALEPGSSEAIEVAQEGARAEEAFDDVLDEVIETNIDPQRLAAILSMSTKQQVDAETGEPIEESSPRGEKIADIKAANPARADQIEALVSAYDNYYGSGEKRPLEDANDVKRLLRGQGVLEFRIAVRTTTPVEEEQVAKLRKELREGGPLAQKADARWKWFQVDAPENWVADVVDSIRRDDRSRPVSEIRAEVQELLANDPAAFFQRHSGLVGEGDGTGRYFLLLWDTPDRAMSPTGPRGDWEVTGARQGTDRLGRAAVDFTLDAMGGVRMRELTEGNVNQAMAIVLDGRVYSAPNINEPLGRTVQVSGRFSQAEINYLKRVLNAGSIAAAISKDPINEETVGPELGADNLRHGLESAIDAGIVVAVFMVIYYFFAGAVADLALAANLVIILGFMSSLQATFTLPGIAGIVLTIGMCVDANVLIYERIREELRAGAGMAEALRLGYQRAFSSIIDGNVTNLIVCLILGYTATADVKGFAVTLGIGICATLFTALFMTRVIYDTWYAIAGYKGKMRMLPMVVPVLERMLHPKIDWIGKRMVFFTASGIVLAVCVSMIVMRGSDILDIEFRAGTEIAFELKEGQTMTRAEVVERLADTPLRKATVVVVGEQTQASGFRIVATEDTATAEVMKDTITDTLGDKLKIKKPLTFAASALMSARPTPDQPEAAPVYPITSRELGEVINDPNAKADVTEYRGGVAILLKDISPPATREDLLDRIKAMRLQPDYEQLQFRTFDVIGLSTATEGGYRSAVVVSRDPAVNYQSNRETWWSQLAATEWNLVRDALTREQSFGKISEITGTVAQTIATNATVALTMSIIAIVAYIWFRFGSLRYGLAAIAALVHDLIVALGLVAASSFIYAALGENFLLIEPFKINMGMIAALLTIVGYSLNDTIVLFDRVRENRGKLAHVNASIINDSINQVISRTVLTSLTTFLAVAMMYLFGGHAIRGFMFALVVGVIVGTYSSVAIASPLLLLGAKLAAAREKTDSGGKVTTPA